MVYAFVTLLDLSDLVRSQAVVGVCGVCLVALSFVSALSISSLLFDFNATTLQVLSPIIISHSNFTCTYYRVNATFVICVLLGAAVPCRRAGCQPRFHPLTPDGASAAKWACPVQGQSIDDVT